MKTTFLATLISFFFITTIFCQSKVIHLKNPSFEGYPRAGRVPLGWIDCGFAGESPPDIHPSGAFEVTQTPADGQTYLGLAVRDNDTWEGVGQKLASPLISGQCYAFKINLCKSNLYTSLSKSTGKTANYVEPIKLVLWGGNLFCEKKEKLGETPAIEHTDWKSYLFTFQPEKEYQYIELEAFYKTPVLFPYNGNLLIDNASPMIPIPCDSSSTWEDDKYEELFSETVPAFVTIEASDIDSSAQISPSIALRQPILTIHYNSSLDADGRTKVLKEIVEFSNYYPNSKATIIIEESTKSERKIQKGKLLRDLKNLGIGKSKCKITLLKK